MNRTYFLLLVSLTLTLSNCTEDFSEVEPLEYNLFHDPNIDLIRITNYEKSPFHFVQVNYETDYAELESKYKARISNVVVILNNKIEYKLDRESGYFTLQLTPNNTYILKLAFFSWGNGISQIYEEIEITT